jgi:HK97 family phage major capsid protein
VAKRRSSADIQAEMSVIQEQALELESAEGTDEEVAANVERSKALLTEFDDLDKELADAVDYEKRVEAVRSRSLNPANRDGADRDGKYLGTAGPQYQQKVDPFDTDPRALNKADAISRAMSVIDREKRVPITDGNKEHLEYLIHRSEDEDESQFDGSYVARRTLFTENPLYRSAWQKYMRLGSLAAYNADEQRAIATFQDFEIRRAASENTTTAGGFGVPVLIDPTIIITSGAADAPLLRICRVEQVTNNVWKGVSSAGMTWSYDTEAAEVSDDTPVLAQPTVVVHMARGFIPHSIEVAQDYPGFAMEMGRLLDQGYTDLLAAKTMTGTGTAEPWGIFNALDANTFAEVVTTTDGAFGGEDVFKVWNALPERYRSRATWVMSVHVQSAIRKFAAAATTGSAYFTIDLTGGTFRINDRPVIITDYAPTFSSTVPGTTGAANILAVGDFSNYLVAQRAGMSVETVQHMFHTSNNLPSGQRGIFAYARNGADSINDLGFRLLQNQ